MSQFYDFELTTGFNKTRLNVTRAEFSSEDPNVFYEGADIAFMMAASALALFTLPGLALFYSGFSERSSALSMMWLSMITSSVIGIQWFLWGYSIAFTGSGSGWGGSEGLAFSHDLTIPWGYAPGPKIPQLVYASYKGVLACFSAAIVSGAVLRKSHPIHFLAFIVIWSTFIFDTNARYIWNPVGFLRRWTGDGHTVFDKGGGAVIHVSSAAAAAVYSFFCGKTRRLFFSRPRLSPDEERSLYESSRTSSMINVVLGTFFLWIGWMGISGGSALGANLRAVSACITTHLAACAGGLTGTLQEYIATEMMPPNSDGRKLSVVGFCNGMVVGLVTISAGAGYVPIWAGPIFGIAGSLLCSLVDYTSAYCLDTQHIFVTHGAAGGLGMLLTAVLARADIAALDGHSVILIGRSEQIGIQFSTILFTWCWSSVGSSTILFFMEAIIYLYRKIMGLPEPDFRILTDGDVLLERL